MRRGDRKFYMIIEAACLQLVTVDTGRLNSTTSIGTAACSLSRHTKLALILRTGATLHFTVLSDVCARAELNVRALSSAKNSEGRAAGRLLRVRAHVVAGMSVY